MTSVLAIGQTIVSGGLVTGTDLTDGAGLKVQVTLATGYVGAVSQRLLAFLLHRLLSFVRGIRLTGNMVELFTSMPFSSTYNILVVNNSAGNIAQWSGNGRLYINQGGLEIAAGATVIP
jgi:hypothetical protein